MRTSCAAAAAASVGSCLVCVMKHFPSCKLDNFSPDTDAIDAFCQGQVLPPPPPAAAAVMPTGGNVWPVAIYWIYIDVGTPPKRFPVAIDSGSDTLDIQGPGCANCPSVAPNRAYDPAASTTAVACTNVAPRNPGAKDFGCVSATFSNSYQTCDLSDPSAPCEITGSNYMEAVSVGGLGPVKVNLGAITAQSANFDQFKKIDGVIGLAGAAGSGNVFSQLHKAGFVDHDIFGMCLARGSSSNGTFTLGGLDPRLYTGDIAWAANVGGNGLGFDGLYQLEMSGIAVGGTVLDSAVFNQPAILDSGTNVLLLPTPLFGPVLQAFRSLCTPGVRLTGLCGVPAGSKSLLDGGCFAMTPAELAAFPTVKLLLVGISPDGLTMPPTSYLLANDPRAASRPGDMCFGIRDTGVGGLLIIGDTTMENYYVAFDRENSRVGWAQRTDACGSV